MSLLPIADSSATASTATTVAMAKIWGVVVERGEGGFFEARGTPYKAAIVSITPCRTSISDRLQAEQHIAVGVGSFLCSRKYTTRE